MTREIVAVVTGASRGIGKGAALALGAAGATVYVTGRTLNAGDGALPGSIRETAEQVTRAGGRGIAIQCDHGVDEQVGTLFKQVEGEAGRLDILVNNATFLHNDLPFPGQFWEKSIELANILDVGLRSAYVASYHAAPLMVRQRSGLIANISFYSVGYFGGPAYGAQKAGLDKLSADMAVELTPHNVAVISIWPGYVRTERIVMRRGAELPGYESPEFTGRVIEALFRDPDLMSYSGGVVIGAEYAQAHGIKDVDGQQPISRRDKLGSPRPVWKSD